MNWCEQWLLISGQRNYLLQSFVCAQTGILSIRGSIVWTSQVKPALNNLARRLLKADSHHGVSMCSKTTPLLLSPPKDTTPNQLGRETTGSSNRLVLKGEVALKCKLEFQ